jgi:hypothetical protein
LTDILCVYITVDGEMNFVYCCNRVCNLFCKCTRCILVMTEMSTEDSVLTHIRRSVRTVLNIV